MKNLFCKKLAACLCIKQSPPSSSPEPRLVMYRNDRSVDVANGIEQNNIKASSSETTEQESLKVLKEIRDLLGTGAHKEEQRNEADKPHNTDEDERENGMTNDWMLVAALLDRICGIIVAVIYVVGTVVLIALVTTHS